MTYTSSSNTLADGYNLIGNPYPSPISWNAVKGMAENASQITAVVKRWSNSSSYFGQYADWNGTVGTNGGNDNIALGQAFFVKSLSGCNSFNMDNTVRRSVPGALFFEEEPTSEVNNMLRLKIRGEKGNDEAVVYFDDAAGDGYDPNYDAPKMLGVVAGLPNIYTRIPDGNLSINVLGKPNENKEIPLDVVITGKGIHSLEVAEMQNIDADMEVYLEDRAQAVFHNLREVKQLMLDLTPGTHSGRYFIHYAVNASGMSGVNAAGDLFRILPNPASDMVNLTFRRGFVPQNIEVFDALGRRVESSSGSSFSVRDLSNGVYHIRVTSEEGQHTKPFVVAH
jgi:hypothetical protein